MKEVKKYDGRPDIQQHHITDKMRSINKAVKHYMPDDAFSKYLSFFMQNLDRPMHRAALDNSFRHLKDQLDPIGSPEDPDFKPPYPSDLGDILFSDMQGKKPNEARGLANSLFARKNLCDHPDVVLTLAIFHAAHKGFISQLDAAFNRAKETQTITEDEHDNANFTVNSVSFKQFDILLLFSTMAPLIMHEYKKLNSVSEDEATQKKQAIGNAWELFFTQRMLTRDYDSKSILPTEKNPEGGGAQTCPAHQHLKASKDMNLLETTFDYVDQHLRGSEHITRAQKAIDEAMTPKERSH